MDAINNYWQEKIAYDQSHQPTMVKVQPADAPLFNHAILFKNISDRGSMTDAELRYFIQRNFLAIINNVFDDSTRTLYTSAFQDVRFLEAFIDVISTIQFFELDQIVKINLIIYHYITLSDEQKNADVVNRMIKISNIINRLKLTAIKKFGLPELIENLLVIARYSDFNLDVCVKRVDLIIITSPAIRETFAEPSNFDYYSQDKDPTEKLAQLLAELYKGDEWMYVFPYFMLDRVSDYGDEEWITEEVEATNRFLELAVLFVLENLINYPNRLRAILLNYAEGYRILNRRKPIRFSMQSLSDDYPRINSTVKYLAEEEGIIVP